MRNPSKISGRVFMRSIQKSEYGLAKVKVNNEEKMIPFLLKGLGKEVVDGASIRGVLISQNCKGFPSDVIVNVEVTRKARKSKVTGVKRSVNGKKKGLLDEVESNHIVIAEESSFERFVSYQPGHWFVSESVEFTPTHDIDPNTGLRIATNVTSV